MYPDINLMDKLNRITAYLVLPIVILLFTISRLGYLNLPFYWDEAWSYATAVFDLAENKLPVLPGTIDPELTRGHPPVFYFLSALWVKIFGTHLVPVHIFPLLVSVIFIIAAFFITRSLFDHFTALTALLLLTLQTLFLSQSTQLLPEIMLALWTLLTFYAYFKRKWILFSVFSILLVMTKETGMVLIGVLFLDKLLIERLFTKGQKKPVKWRIRELALMSIPVLAFISFLVLQKIRNGWFLYPEHIGLTVVEPREILNRIHLFLSRLLFQNGRNVFFILSAVALVYLLIEKSVSRYNAHLLLFSALFILLYIAFSAVNFFTTRYLLSVLPFFIIPASWIITKVMKTNWQKTMALALFMLIFGYYDFIAAACSEQDTSPGYKNTVLLQKQAVNFAEEMHWQQKSVYATFLMQYYLTVPELGYLEDKASAFKEVGNGAGKTYDIYVFCSNENDPLHAIVQNDMNFKLVRRFEQECSWVEWYIPVFARANL